MLRNPGATLKLNLFRRQREIILLAGIVILAAGLRLFGIGWGIPTPTVPHVPFHPDEAWAMSVMTEVDPSKLDFNPEGAHREGALSYHVWTAIALAMERTRLLDKPLPAIKAYDEDYRRLLLASRLFVVLCDLLCVLLVWAIARRITNSPAAGLIAASVLAITPFEVIYSHFMRNHIPANATAMLALFTALRLSRDQRSVVFALCGVATGIAAATRYPAITVGLVPVLIAIGARLKNRDRKTALESLDLRDLIPKLALLIVGAFGGMLAADPYLFLLLFDPENARQYIEVYATFTDADAFSRSSLLDLSKLGPYVTWLIPYGTLPWLWILFYGSSIYVVLRRQYWLYVLPLCTFAIAYFYLMAKGYLAVPGFSRVALFMFPTFAVFCGIAGADFWDRLRSRRLLRGTLTATWIIICGASLTYDIAYLEGMSHDPRLKLHDLLQAEAAANGPRRVCVEAGGWNYFIIDPAFTGLPPSVVDVRTVGDALAEPGSCDVAVLWAFEYDNHARTEARLRHAVELGRWSAAVDLRPRLSFAGIEFNYQRNPHDLVYPFPAIYVVRPEPPEGKERGTDHASAR